jgi:hypothetical protein
LKSARRCTGFILIFIQFCELLNRGGVQSLSLDAVIALGVGGVGMPVHRIAGECPKENRCII